LVLSYPSYDFDWQLYYRYCVGMKVSEILRKLQEDGWYLVVTKGSHRQFKHARKSGRVTVAGKGSDDLPPGTLNSILKQAGLKNQE
jgi:predicted RNA binding protein YcfA (HicA-like mRNA interferase family)